MTNTEMKKISYEKYCEARKEMQEKLETITDQIYPEKRSCNYVEIYADFGYRQPIQAIVNWSSIGSVSPEEACKFAKLLTEAAKLAHGFKYNGYKVYYTDED